jgi:hypothetical protein
MPGSLITDEAIRDAARSILDRGEKLNVNNLRKAGMRVDTRRLQRIVFGFREPEGQRKGIPDEKMPKRLRAATRWKKAKLRRGILDWEPAEDRPLAIARGKG